MVSCNFCEESKYVSSMGIDSLRYHVTWTYCPEHALDAAACRDAVLEKKIGKSFDEVSDHPIREFTEWLK